MFNKFYDRFKGIMKDYGVFIILIIVILIFGFVRIPYDVNIGGGTIDLGNRVFVNGEETSIDGTFNMAYVSVVQGSIPHVLLGLIIPDWEVVPESESVYENESIEDANRRSQLLLEQSKNFAMVAAMDAAKISYEILDSVNGILYISEKATTSLEIGDNILEINGERVNDITSMSEIVQQMDVGAEIEFLVERDGKKEEATAKVFLEDDKKYIGITATTLFDIKSDTKIEIMTKDSESGPSGGLMMALMIYNALTNQDLTHGKMIVGTGAISLDGSVGEIGGVKFKVSGAVKDGADVFLVPKGNYEEALSVKEEKGYNIEIVSVETLQDAIDYLEGL